MSSLDILFPRNMVCLVCGVPSYGEALCASCRKKLILAACRNDVDPDVFIEGVGCAWYHEGVPRKLVHRLKYDAIADAAEVLATGIADLAREKSLPEDMVVTSVPMPKKRLRERGIDHGRTLAEAVARALSLPYEQLLARVGRSHTQRGLNRAQRLRNLTDAFTAAPLHGETVLLIDDVLTTGATALTCARVLREAGAARVWVLTATKARKGGSWLNRLLRWKGWKR